MEDTNKILDNIRNKIAAVSTQTEIAKALKMEQNMLSKRLSGHTKMTLNDLAGIANELNISIAELISDTPAGTKEKYVRQVSPIQIHMDLDGDGIVLNPDKISFNHYLGEYYFYSRPTIKEEQGFLKGRLILRKDPVNNICLSELFLKTGRKDQNGREIVKAYSGQAVISLPTGTFYIFMLSEKYNDFCILNFKHSYFNDADLMCRICGCMTASAGTSTQNRPVVIKTLISREPLSDEDLEKLSGELLMNTSTIYISQKNFDTYIADKIPEKYREMAKHTLEPYYVIQESFLNKEKGNKEELRNLIMLMRQHSSSTKYTKISSSADTFIYDYIMKKKEDEKNEKGEE